MRTTKTQSMNKLVEEKQENAKTAAKAGLFWAVVVAVPIVGRLLKRRRTKPAKPLRDFFKK